jgi:hypothetical protein
MEDLQSNIPKATSPSANTTNGQYHYLPYYEISYRVGDVPVSAVDLPACQRQARGVTLKRSKRWLVSWPNILTTRYHLPLIDRLGRFTGESAYTLPCEPADLLSTTISTIFSRLKRYAAHHNKREIVGKRLRDILRASTYYALSKNSYYMDRILFFLRNLEKNGKLIHRITLYYLSKGDADKRFVYSQVSYNTNWLIFRACRPRDKSPFLHRIGPQVHHSRVSPWVPNARLRSMTTALAENVAFIGRPNGT